MMRSRSRTESRTTWSKTCIQGRRIKATLLRKLELTILFLMHSTHAKHKKSMIDDKIFHAHARLNPTVTDHDPSCVAWLKAAF